MSQSAAVSRTTQMSLEQPFKLSRDYHTGADVLAACFINVDKGMSFRWCSIITPGLVGAISKIISH